MGFRICHLAAKCEPLQLARAFDLEVEETFLDAEDKFSCD